MPYDIEDHQHNYAAWCAATAARRGLSGGNPPLIAALAVCDLRAMLDGLQGTWPQTDAQYAAAHQTWCRQIMHHVDAAVGKPGACSFGRSAKTVAIYIKTRVIVAGHDATAFAHVAYPPVDRILLQNLARDTRFPPVIRRFWRATAWTQLDEADYGLVLESLRDVVGREPFWTLERYWNPLEAEA